MKYICLDFIQETRKMQPRFVTVANIHSRRAAPGRALSLRSKSSYAIAAGITAAILVHCTGISYLPAKKSAYYPPTSSIEILTTIPRRPYTVLGEIVTFIDEYNYRNIAAMIGKKAQSVGGNAVIIEAERDITGKEGYQEKPTVANPLDDTGPRPPSAPGGALYGSLRCLVIRFAPDSLPGADSVRAK
jgi:hypothetical protein